MKGFIHVDCNFYMQLNSKLIEQSTSTGLHIVVFGSCFIDLLKPQKVSCSLKFHTSRLKLYLCVTVVLLSVAILLNDLNFMYIVILM